MLKKHNKKNRGATQNFVVFPFKGFHGKSLCIVCVPLCNPILLMNMYALLHLIGLTLTRGIRPPLLTSGGCLCCQGLDSFDKSWSSGSFTTSIHTFKENNE